MANDTSRIVPSWSHTPIPSLSLSAGGLLALADLNTVAQRTVIRGGSSWLDALVLAPGLHYQQAADALDQESAPGLSAELGLIAAIELRDGGPAARYVIKNVATVQYLKRLLADESRAGDVTLHVELSKNEEGKEVVDQLTKKFNEFMNGKTGPPLGDVVHFELDWLSHAFYLATPIFTAASLIFMVLLEDWWGLSFIVGLMLSRLLNIWVIKQRSRPAMAPLASKLNPPSSADAEPTEYVIDLGSGRRVRLRGVKSDLQALTTQTWLRSKSNLDGYLEAISKLIVYLVAAFSGNLSQAGAMVLMALLLTSAGLLGLSNAHARNLQMHGRIARPQAIQPNKVFDDTDKEKGMVGGQPVESLPTGMAGTTATSTAVSGADVVNGTSC